MTGYGLALGIAVAATSLGRWTLGQDEDPYAMRSRSSRYYLDPRTVPAEPEDPALAVVREWLKVCGPIDAGTEDARDLLARIDAARSDA